MIRVGFATWCASIVVVMLGSGVACAVEAPSRSAKETPLGKIDRALFEAEKRSFWISPDGRRYAFLTEKGINIDGRQHDYEFGIGDNSFSFSPDSQHTAYAARVPHHGAGSVIVIDEQPSETIYSHVSGLTFSPDSKHYGCIARLRASSFDEVPVIDGREGEPAEDFSWEVAFTADSQRMVYAVEIDDAYVMREDSIDGSQPRIQRDHGPAKLTGNFFRGPQGQLGYLAKKEGKQFVVYNGQEEPVRLEEIVIDDIFLSDDGEHLTYLGEPASFRAAVVHKGKRGRVYNDILAGSLAISPDGKHFGYAVKDFRKYFVVLDGQEGKVYDGVTGPVYSPDSKRVGYLAVANGRVFSVVDGREGKAYDDRGMPVFSPDGKSAAYWAEDGGKQFVVVGGQPQQAYDEVGPPFYNQDGSRLVYAARTGDTWQIVDNGQPGKSYTDILGGFVFSDDNQRVAYVALDGEKQKLIVNGVEGQPYDEIINFQGGKIHLDPNGALHYIALQGDELVLVEETAE
ncbi:MAG: PD40 domain-containing protein [Pirellulales bacterium]|nr:PD40 domain-containing protein [Pirellulales bacterium]